MGVLSLKITIPHRVGNTNPDKSSTSIPGDSGAIGGICTVEWPGSIDSGCESVQVDPSTNVVARNASKGTHFCIGECLW